MLKQLFIGLIGVLAINSTNALTLQMSADGNKIGKTEEVRIKRGEKLSTIAKRHGISVTEVIAANPNISHDKLIPGGTIVLIPKYFPIPEGPHEGIILNLANLRIYYFHPDGTTVSTYPVAVGKQGWSTPQGETSVVAKEKNPAWRPPVSIRREAARRGRSLPLVVPAGPHNPLGRYAMRLGFGGILIHGTNQPRSIGTRSSHGCIRMLPKDIEELFKSVEIGTNVRIVHQHHTTKLNNSSTNNKTQTQVKNKKEILNDITKNSANTIIEASKNSNDNKNGIITPSAPPSMKSEPGKLNPGIIIPPELDAKTDSILRIHANPVAYERKTYKN